MAVWLIRAGSHGEYEQKFIQEGRAYVTWDGLDVNLLNLSSRQELAAIMIERYPDAKPKAITNWVSQVWPFAHEMKKGDYVILPLKTQPAICVGEIDGDYQFEPSGPDPYFHWRKVKWLAEEIPRENFGQDLLDSFRSLMTICRIQRNNAESRIAAMKLSGWKPETAGSVTSQAESSEADGGRAVDLEAAGRDQIARLIMARFKGHGLTRLVEAILKAQGYTTYRSPEGPDGGADILAGAGPMGFSSPKLVVEVKSDASAADRPTVDKLLGAVTKFGADEGLFVSWSGFKNNVYRELASNFFRIRLWSQNELVEQLFAHYDQLDDDVKTELPLKRIWIVAAQDED